MPARVEYKASIEQDLKRLDAAVVRRLLRKVERSLASGEGGGTALAGDFAGLYRLRVGDYRVIYARTGAGYLVLRIGHRREVYREGRPVIP